MNKKELQATAYTDGTDVILAKHWTGSEPPFGWIALFTESQSLALTRRLIEMTEHLRDERASNELNWERIRSAGWGLANLAHDLSKKSAGPLGLRNRFALERASREWDEAMGERRGSDAK